MAKQKDLKEFTDGILGAPKEEQQELPQPLVSELRLSPEMEETLSAVRRAKAEQRAESPRRQDKTTFLVDREIIRRIKYISLATDRQMKDIIAEALQGYLDKWESRNGKIYIPKIKG